MSRCAQAGSVNRVILRNAGSHGRQFIEGMENVSDCRSRQKKRAMSDNIASPNILPCKQKNGPHAAVSTCPGHGAYRGGLESLR